MLFGPKIFVTYCLLEELSLSDLGNISLKRSNVHEMDPRDGLGLNPNAGSKDEKMKDGDQPRNKY